MRLPVSGAEVRYRTPNGRDDLAILEAGGSALEQALATLPRLAAREDGMAVDWSSMTVTDFEACLLGLRQALVGDRLACGFRCAACGERMELELSIAEFLGGIESAQPRGAVAEADGWFRLAGPNSRFRCVNVGDQLEVLNRPGGAKRLAERCAGAADARALRRIERTMEAIAPAVSRELAGDCAGCGAAARLTLYVPAVVMEELRLAAAGVYGETHTIAAAYHWPEAAILEMPRGRRQAYAEMIRGVAQ